jgi:PASTA domain/PKD domain
MTAFWRRSPVRSGVAAVVSIAAVGSVVLFGGGGNAAQDVRLLSGAAWLASGKVGQVSLLDGSSAEVSAQVQVAPSGSVIDVVQAGANAYAVDQSSRTIRRIDGATFQAGQPEVPIADAQALTAFAGSGKLYVVDTRRGLIVNADPASGKASGEVQNFVPQIAPDTTAIDSQGRLWIADNATGDVLTYTDGDDLRPIKGVGKPGRSILTMSNDKPVVIDTEGREALIVDPDSRGVDARISLDLRAGEQIQVSGSPHGDRTYIVASRGLLTICELAKRACDQAVPLADGKLGAAVEAGNRLFVPDYNTGKVWIVDLERHTVVAQPQVLKTNKQFQLLNRDGKVFFNDPDSEQAGVIQLDGGVDNIAKYDASNPNKGLNTPVAGPAQTPSDQPGAQVGQSVPPQQQQSPTQPPVQPTQPSQPSQPIQPEQPQNPQNPQNPQQPQDSEDPGTPPPAEQQKPVLRITMSKHSPVMNEDVTLKVDDTNGTTPAEATWSFGDTKTGTGATIGHRWAKEGTYQVGVQVKMPDGQTATASRTVEVTKPPDVTVPSVLGQTKQAATTALQGVGLKVVAAEVASNTVAAGRVITQNPAGGQVVPPQSTVTIQVSTGKRAAFDLLAKAPAASWRSGAGSLSYNGNDGDERGFALTRSGLRLEDGSGGTYLETHPQWVTNGFIEGTYTLPAPIIPGDRFKAKIGFIKVAGATSKGDATFVVSVIKNGAGTVVASVHDSASDGQMRTLNVDLTAQAGATGIRLRVNAGPDSSQDWASWVGPRIEG